MTQRAIKRVTEDIEQFCFNTAISALMEFYNFLSRITYPKMEVPFYKETLRDAMDNLALLLSPCAPHLGEALWEMLGHTPSISQVAWPTYDPAFVGHETVTVVVQINGKIKAKFNAQAAIPDELLQAKALSEPKVISAIAGQKIKKIFVVKGKLINIVL
jgi:leucyl-tRNA synthetase